MLPRGIRNHNPLNIRRSESHQARLNGRVSTDEDKVNIRRSKDQWKGMAEVQTDRAFVQFKSLEYGWRAAFYLLTRTYYHKYRLYTIRGIISRWAPANENDTSAYIANVSRLTGIDPDEPIGIPSENPRAGWQSAWQWRCRRMARTRWITSPCCEDGRWREVRGEQENG